MVDRKKLVDVDLVIRLIENMSPEAYVKEEEPARWIEFPEYYPYCSVCREYSVDAKYGRGNYCPNCGRPMSNP